MDKPSRMERQHLETDAPLPPSRASRSATPRWPERRITRRERGRLSQPVEDEMDDTPEGVTTGGRR
jgi:hypothetical protein